MNRQSTPGTPGCPDKPRKPRSRRRAKDAPTHVRTVALRPTPAQRSMIDLRLTVGVRFYNACLNEMHRRIAAVRSDPGYPVAVAMAKGPDRNRAFQTLEMTHRFTETAAMSHASSLRVTWLRQHILAQEAQVLGRRAFTALRRWQLGLGGRPRYKTSRKGLRSLSAKDLNGALHPVHQGGQVMGFQWGRDHRIAFAAPKPTGRRGREQRAERSQVEDLILTGKVLSAKIVKTVIGGRTTYRAQLTCDGPRPQRHPVGIQVVSFDLGPSVNAVVTATAGPDGTLIPTTATRQLLAPQLTDSANELRRMQRHLDRQHRAGSPACFHPDGRHIARRCHWHHRSKRAERTSSAIAELHRTRAAYRKTSHGQMLNSVLVHGSTIHTEKLNYTAWQKTWGRSVRDRAPGLLVEMGRSKAESAGGGLYEYSTYTTRLSQACLCGAIKKKPVSQRVHRCDCGITSQRDLFSAFLGLFMHRTADPDHPDTLVDTLDLDQANKAWTAAPEIEWMPKPSNNTAPPKQRGQVRPSRRSMARITKRRHAASDRAVRQKVEQPHVTALAA